MRTGLLTVVAVFLSPLLVCGLIVRQLFAPGELVLAFVYSGFLLPCLMFFLLLAGTTAMLGVAEGMIRVEKEVAERVKIVSELATVIKGPQQQTPDDSK